MRGWLDQLQVDLHYAVKARNDILQRLGDTRRITMRSVVLKMNRHRGSGVQVDRLAHPSLSL